MKDKKLIVLSVLVAVIWGTISYKIYASLTRDEAVHLKRNIHIPDTVSHVNYALQLNYSDPFFKRKKVSTSVKKKIVKAPVFVAVPQIIIDWGKLSYHGMFTGVKQVPTAIVSIAGVEYFVKEKHTVQEFLVSEIAKDSIKVSYQSQFKYLKRIKQE